MSHSQATWTCTSCTYPNHVSAKKCVACGFEQKWQCPICTYQNKKCDPRCRVCHAKPSLHQQKDIKAKNVKNTWRCQDLTCQNVNNESDARCIKCNEPKEYKYDPIPMQAIQKPLAAFLPLTISRLISKKTTQQKAIKPSKNCVDIKTSESSWYCSICTLENDAASLRCIACNFARTNNSADDVDSNTVSWENHNVSYTNPPFEQRKKASAEPTIEDFDRCLSDIACYNQKPSAVFPTLRSVAKKTIKDEKYRTLDLTNVKVQKRLLAFDGVLDFLLLLGFESDVDGTKLICKKVPTTTQVHNAITACNSHMQRFRMAIVNSQQAKLTKEDSLIQIIEWATYVNFRNPEFMDALLLTHKMFMDSMTLLRLLRQRFFIPIPEHILNINDENKKEAAIKDFQGGVQKQIHWKVLKGVRDWANNYWHEDWIMNQPLQSAYEDWLNELSKFNEFADYNKNCHWIPKVLKVLQKELAYWKQTKPIPRAFQSYMIRLRIL